MNRGLTKARTPRSRTTPSKALQKKLLAAATDKGIETRQVQSPVNRGLIRSATSESDPLPAKKARLTRIGTRWARVEGAEQTDKTDRQQPNLKTLKRPHTPPPRLKIGKPDKISPASQLWKRRIYSDSENDERQLKRARLTRKNLALFNKMGRRKTKTGNSASVPPEPAFESSTSRTTSATTSDFAIQAHKNRILHPLQSKPPTNLEDMSKRYTRSRATASPPELEYKRYANSVGKAPNEATMVFEVGEHMLKRYSDKGYNRAFNQAFTGFPKDVGFNNGLSTPQPDFVEGLEMDEYRPVPLDKHVNAAVLYKDDPFSLTLPHLAGEWKGRGKDMEKARLQSAYDGAALVYARNQALSYLGKPDPPGHAEVRTFTTDGTNVNFYAHYAAPSEEGGTLEYHQYQYASTNVKDTYQGHNDGRKGIRNEQDHAREQSYTLRDQLKEHWKHCRGGVQPIAEGAPLHGAGGILKDANEDEDEADCEVVQQPCQSTPVASSQLLRAASSV